MLRLTSRPGQTVTFDESGRVASVAVTISGVLTYAVANGVQMAHPAKAAVLETVATRLFADGNGTGAHPGGLEYETAIKGYDRDIVRPGPR